MYNVTCFYVLFLVCQLEGPSLAESSLDKQDIPQMHKDIVKCEQSGVFMEENKNNWEDFCLRMVPAEEPKWILEDFSPVSISCRNVPDVNVFDKVQKQTRAMQQITEGYLK